jgi:hypothetical protein
VAVILAAAFIASAGQSPSAKSDENVTVVNSTAAPVPVVVQGNASIGGTVQSQQAGSWNVGILGTPTVKVGSSDTSPLFVRSVDEPGRHPYQSGFKNIAFPAGPSAFDLELSFEQQIPQGATAVIEHVSVAGLLPANESLRGFLVCQANGTSEIRHALLFEDQKSTDVLGNALRVVSQTIRCYAAHGGLHVELDNAQPESFAIFVSGYLVS